MKFYVVPFFSHYVFDYPKVIIMHEIVVVVNVFFFSIAGITLALFGGVRKHSDDSSKVPVRGDIHVLVVGMLKLFPL